MFAQCCNFYSSTSSCSNSPSAHSVQHLLHTWATSCQPTMLRWTVARCKRWWTGQYPSRCGHFAASWASRGTTGYSSKTWAPSRHPSESSSRRGTAGPWRLTLPFKPSRRHCLQHQFCTCQTSAMTSLLTLTSGSGDAAPR